MSTMASLGWRRQSQQHDQGCWDESALGRWIETSCDESGSSLSVYASISYESLNTILVLLCRKLHAIISRMLEDDAVIISSRSRETTSNRISVPIAIAVPEGPYLPLAVAAVHALNDGFNFSTVLVPVDPDEGLERLRRILDDAQPLIALVAADCHLEKIQQTVKEACHDGATQLYHVFDNSQALYLSQQTMVMDVRQIVAEIAVLTKDDRIANVETDITRTTIHDDGATYTKAVFRKRIRHYESHIIGQSKQSCFAHDSKRNCISHIVYTSGTTGVPKGCISSINALDAYVEAKNNIHGITSSSVVLLASAVSFDPCFSDVLATFNAGATLYLARREDLRNRLDKILSEGRISHVLCTPTLWSTLSITSSDATSFPCLRVVALGGERIPQQTIRTWARKSSKDDRHCRLFATYGVTEACVYQTMGEVIIESESTVGTPFDGMKVLVCKEGKSDALVVGDQGEPGEIVLFGNQIDEYSAYLRRPELTGKKFLYNKAMGGHCYRTGDRGCIIGDTEEIRITGRIDGETGMIKYNGVRIELGEVESAIIDDNTIPHEAVVVDCMVVLKEDDTLNGSGSLLAYVVLSKQCLNEMGVTESLPCTGVLCSGELLALLVQRCKQRSRATPSAFILIPVMPLTRTGKRNKDAAFSLGKAVPLAQLISGMADGVPLSEYNALGALVAEQIIDCLNLLPCQISLLSTEATFAMLGGDSLTATRVVRALYACHHDVFNSRQLGGAYGTLDDDTFSVRHLVQASNLGAYVDFLQGQNVLQNLQHSSTAESRSVQSAQTSQVDSHEAHLYDALLRSTMQGKTLLALALIEAGAKPNVENSRKYRLSNTRGIQERKTIFHSTPLHFACLNGIPQLTRVLLLNGAKLNVPDAVGMFPIHVAASRDTKTEEYSEEEDDRRTKCVKLLLESGAPIQMKDGNKQSILHFAARSGLKHLLLFVMKRWKVDLIEREPKKYRDSYDWRDRWSRTPVHWAIINSQVDALDILLKNGCSPTPAVPKKNASTNAALESPLDTCRRLFGDSPKGSAISKLLKDAMADSEC